MGFCDYLYGEGFATSNPSKLVQTSWIDPNALRNYLRKSLPSTDVVRVIAHQFTTHKSTRVHQLKYLDNQIPTCRPVQKFPTGYILDFSDSIWDEPLAAANGCIDNLLKDVDIESSLGSSSQGDSRAQVTFKPGANSVECYQVRADCGSIYFCDLLDRNLINVVRYNLETVSREILLEAQRETQRKDGSGDTGLLALIHVRLKTVAAGAAPVKYYFLKQKPNGPSGGHTHFVACSGWTTLFRNGHCTCALPIDVEHGYLDLELKGKCKATAPIDSCSNDTTPCSNVIHPHTVYAHVVNEMSVESPIVKHKCLSANQLYLNDKGKEARYYHRWQEFPDKGVVIFVCYTSMLALLYDAGVDSFEDDTTFKRLRDLNEWKLVICYKVLQRNHHLSRLQVFEGLKRTTSLRVSTPARDNIQQSPSSTSIVRQRTPSSGSLTLYAAQILGASWSLLKTNQPKYSGIYTEDPAEFATCFVKLCSVHVLCGIKDFRGMVSDADFWCLQNFQHLKSHDAGVEFTQFVADLGIKKISGMHVWRNRATVINLPLVDGMEGSRKLDYKTVLRNNSRASSAARKVREAHEQEDQVIELQAKLDASRAMRKESMAMEKELQAELKAAKSNKMTQRKSTKPVVVSSLSSGRVKTTQVHTDAGDKCTLLASEPNINDGFATASTAPGESIIDFTAPTGITMDISLSPDVIPDASLPANTTEFDEFLSKICAGVTQSSSALPRFPFPIGSSTCSSRFPIVSHVQL
ncbi:hypothetical protein R3P38DRAFT_3353396 [Favolaschia claudopus]|uniref:Uncharacterized protein n=1 Tax=Favolaschia claudopus TaxID=2862362 RepID=A0AAW0BZ02_9AGAR